MLKLELYIALYLLLGVATWSLHKKVFEDVEEENGDYDSFTHSIFMLMIILGWWVFILAYVFDFVHYNYKRIRNNRRVCGAKFPQDTLNVDLRCGLAKHPDDVFHEGVTQEAYGRWHVDEDGTVYIDRVKTF